MLLPFPDAQRDPADLAMLPASRLVPPPITARRLARALGVMFVLVLVGLAIAPWQQNVSGAGRVIAFLPVDRQQSVQAPIKGVIETWYVREGERVKKGQPLARLRDNDPEYFQRLQQTRETVEVQLTSYENQVIQLGSYVEALEDAREQAVAAAQAGVDQAEQKVRATAQKLAAAEAADETASINLRRSQTLHEKGLISDRKLELATLKATKTQTDRRAAEADKKAAEGSLREKRSALRNKRAEATAKVENARASRGKAEVSVQDARQKLLDVDVKLARQRTQEILAPIDAFVLRIAKAPGQEQVKQGDLLTVLVPDTQDRVAEVYVDGNDAALITPGRKVRLQFEGWPAVQFAGWPSVAVGT
ncbi:MAG: biotin/lipoyl-binding protein, partial [Myxococcota bacterium]